MPKPVTDESLRRELVSVRLPKWLIKKIDSLGKRTEVIERALLKQVGVRDENS